MEEGGEGCMEEGEETYCQRDIFFSGWIDGWIGEW